MKINEVTDKQLDEGVWDNLKAGAKGIGQGWQAAGQPAQPGVLGKISGAIKGGQNVLNKIGGAYQGAKAGYQAQKVVGQQQAINKQVIDKAIAAYNQWAAKIQASGVEVTPDQAVDWFKKFTNTTPASPPGTNPAQIQQWLSREIPNYIANKAARATPGTKPADAPATQQAQPQATQQPAVDQSASSLPDISQLTREELIQLKQQLQAA
jgi:hypothetical protein